MDYLSLCLIAKDEDEYLQEWLDYHILVGVERFYIYDNESKNPIRDLLKEYIDADWVVIHEIEGTAVQVMAYQHCLQTYGEYSRWIGFIDADEFIVLTQEIDLKLFLNKYEAYGGLAVSSVFFGTGGHVDHPVGGQIINYQERFPLAFDDNELIKSIVQPKRVVFPRSPHDFAYRENYFCVNSKGFRVDTQKFPIWHEEIRLNHYFTRSENSFSRKIDRLGGDGRQIQKGKLEELRNLLVEKDDTLFVFLKNSINFDYDKKDLFSKNDNLFIQFLHKRAALYPVNKTNKKNSHEVTKIEADKFIPINWDLDKKKEKLKLAENWNEIKKLYPQFKIIYPDSPKVYTDYANICLLTNDFNSAKVNLELAFQKFGETFENLRVLSDYWVFTKQFDKAENTFIKCLQYGESVDILLRLSYVLIENKKYDQAIIVIQKILDNYNHSAYLKTDFSKTILINFQKLLNSFQKNDLLSKYEPIIHKIGYSFPS